MSGQDHTLLSTFDGHSVDQVRFALGAGADAAQPIQGKLPVYWLLEEYTRSDRLPDCLRLLLSAGATLDDALLVPVLLDDGEAIKEIYDSDPSILTHRTSLVSSFTSMIDVTLLHVAAEFGNVNTAKKLIELGADVNAAAGKDENGVGGHPPIFHTVNSNANRSAPIMHILLDAGAKCDIRLDALDWGKGYPWETTFFDITPISYAQIGLLPQVHRNELDIYDNIQAMLEASGRKMPPLKNVPNQYLQPNQT